MVFISQGSEETLFDLVMTGDDTFLTSLLGTSLDCACSTSCSAAAGRNSRLLEEAVALNRENPGNPIEAAADDIVSGRVRWDPEY